MGWIHLHGSAPTRLVSMSSKTRRFGVPNPRAIAGAMLGLTLFLMHASPADAHEHRDVGTLGLTVGWVNEPTLTGFSNAVLIVIVKDSRPIIDLAPGDLKVTAQFGTASSDPLDLEPAFEVGEFGVPGEYHASLIPTRAGTYVFHFSGTVKGVSVEEAFTCGETTFDCPQESSSLEFPARDPSNAELALKLKRLETRLTASRDANRSSRQTVLYLSIAAAVLALAAIILSLNRRAK